MIGRNKWPDLYPPIAAAVDIIEKSSNCISWCSIQVLLALGRRIFSFARLPHARSTQRLVYAHTLMFIILLHFSYYLLFMLWHIIYLLRWFWMLVPHRDRKEITSAVSETSVSRHNGASVGTLIGPPLCREAPVCLKSLSEAWCYFVIYIYLHVYKFL